MHKPNQDGSTPGIIFANGKNWQEQRRFTLHTLKNLGFGKKSMEDVVVEEVTILCEHLETLKGKPVNMRNEFNISILSTLWQILSNERLDRDNEDLKELVKMIDMIFRTRSNLAFRIAVKLMPVMLAYGRLKEWVTGEKRAESRLTVVSENAVSSHEKSFQEGHLRDFIDHYLQEMNVEDSKIRSSFFKGETGRNNLRAIVRDLFFGGEETTSTALNWCMLFMILHPDIQTKVQEELDNVTGKSRMITLNDKPEIPYTEAVIHEVMRMGNIFPLSVTHYTATGGSILGGTYHIPENSKVYFHLGGVLYDPKYFPNPNTFDPTRYLSMDGKFTPHPKNVAFGMGRRKCLGESLARMEIFLFFTHILSKFRLTKWEDGPPLSMEPLPAVTNSPQMFELCFLPRE